MKILTKRQILLLHTALIGQSGGSDGIRTLDYNGLLSWLQCHIES